MQIQSRFQPLAFLAGAAVGADVVGRLLAPSLLGTWPLLVVALSPSDPHLLLARVEPRALLIGTVLTARIGRAVLVYCAVATGLDRLRNDRLRRLLIPARKSRWAGRSAVVGVILLPGVAGAVVAARQRMRPVIYLVLLVGSMCAGVAITLTAATFVEAPLAHAADWVETWSLPLTGAIAIAVAASLCRRLRATSAANDRAQTVTS